MNTLAAQLTEDFHPEATRLFEDVAEVVEELLTHQQIDERAGRLGTSDLPSHLTGA
jgi:hypothetical protein